jgi:hypothetical protein
VVRRRSGATKLGCLLYVMGMAAVLYFGIPAGETYFRYLQYKDAMRQELRFRSNLPNDRIRAHLQVAADSLGLPAEAGDVTVHRDGNTITVEAAYDEILEFPGFTKAIHYRPRAVDRY